MPEGRRTSPLAPAAVRVAALLAALEGAALLLLAAYLAVKPAFTAPGDLGIAEGGAAVTALGGAVLLRLAVGVSQARRWARTPTFVLQVLALPVGYTLVAQGGLPEYGVPVLVPALVTIGALARAEAAGAFGGHD